MLQSRDKISLKQVFLMCITVEFTPLIRLSGGYITETAKQAAWVSGIFSIIPITILLFMLKAFYKKYKEYNFMDIIKDITGNFVGRIIIILYFMWFILLLALYIRYYAERLLSTLLPNIHISIYLILMLIIVTLALRSGITVIARMNEVIITTLLIILFFLFIFAIPLVKIENIIPICFTDIIPIFMGSVIFGAIYGYLIVFFFFGNQINDKEHLLKYGMYKITLVVVINTILLLLTIGALGWSITARLPRSAFVLIRQISVLGIAEKIESFIIAFWVLADFIIIAVFAYTSLSVIKDFFKLSTFKPLIIVFMILAYFLSILIGNNSFELEKASQVFFIPINIIFEYAIPLLLFIVGKVRKKI